MFISRLFSEPRQFAATALIVIFSICAHEFMHAFVALKCGDSTAADRGHLTMNPFKQMGLMSLVMLAILGIAWGQVPVNPANLRTRGARIAVSVAGVAANLALAAIFALLCALAVVCCPHREFAVNMLFYGSSINLVLMVVNLFPVPGFDGWKILTEFWRPNTSSQLTGGVFFVMVIALFYSIEYIYGAAFSVALLAVRLLTGGRV